MIDARKHTFDSVKKLTDYSDFNLYKMDICYDYSIDKIIDRGIFDDESALGAILQEVLPDYPVNLKMPNFGCSAFTMKNPDSVMMGRNYDFKNDTSSMLVYCSPKDGYRSVAFAALDNVGANNPELSDETRLATLLSPFISLDGINEKGVSIAVLTLDSKPVRQQSGKPVIAQRLQSVSYLTELRQPKRRLHFLKNTICSPQAEEIITFMLPIQTVTVVLLSTIATAMNESLLLQNRLPLQTFL